MNLINAENITKAYTERRLFECASFSLQEGEKVGIIGINGTGKSTLLKMLAGQEEPDAGTITMASHVVIQDAIEANGRDYRFETEEHPIPALRNRTKDNTTLGRIRR